MKEKQLLLVGVYLLLSAILVDSSVSGNRPPRFIIDEQTEIVIRLKEGPDTPAGKFFFVCKTLNPVMVHRSFALIPLIMAHIWEIICIERVEQQFN